MKAIREKILKKMTAKDKSSPSSSSKTLIKLAENKVVSSLKKTSKLVKNDELVSLDKNDNEVTTFTPQMSILYEKIQRRNLNKSNLDKFKMNTKNKQQEVNMVNQESIKIQERHTKYQENMNRNNEQYRNNKKQYAQKSYSQNISSK